MTFGFWVKLIAKDITQKGIDTVVLVPNATRTAETNIIKNYGKAKLNAMHPWIEQLTTTGVIQADGSHAPVCSYDIKNLDHLAKLLLDSLTTEFQQDVLKTAGVDADGIHIFCVIIQKRIHLDPSLQRTLIDSFQKVKLIDEKGENVEKFNHKVKECIDQITNAGPEPEDLALLTIKLYFGASVPMFSQNVNNLFLTITSNRGALTHDDIMTELEQLYLKLKDKEWTPSTSKVVTHQEFAKYQQNTETKDE